MSSNSQATHERAQKRNKLLTNRVFAPYGWIAKRFACGAGAKWVAVGEKWGAKNIYAAMRRCSTMNVCGLGGNVKNNIHHEKP